MLHWTSFLGLLRTTPLVHSTALSLKSSRSLTRVLFIVPLHKFKWLIFCTQASKHQIGPRVGWEFVLTTIWSSANQNISRYNTAAPLWPPDINSALLPTPCSPLIAFKIVQGPTWKDYYSNPGSSFIGLEEVVHSGAGWKIWRGEPWGLPTVKPSWRCLAWGCMFQKMINALRGKKCSNWTYSNSEFSFCVTDKIIIIEFLSPEALEGKKGKEKKKKKTLCGSSIFGVWKIVFLYETNSALGY